MSLAAKDLRFDLNAHSSLSYPRPRMHHWNLEKFTCYLLRKTRSLIY